LILTVKVNISGGGRDAWRIPAALGIKQIEPAGIEKKTAESRKMPI